MAHLLINSAITFHTTSLGPACPTISKDAIASALAAYNNNGKYDFFKIGNGQETWDLLVEHQQSLTKHMNMRRHNNAMHALLELNENDDILCVQEPWFGTIGTARSDKQRDSEWVLGGAKHQNWLLHYPSYTSDKRAKVMIYSR
ncbi:hypothetical protein EDB84DRAFT_1573102 [Lactarius hengduanensis]|nr:hypothetical protein EDB84DRAFT_1573102 [Lactarius hengduanensis]